MSANAVLIAKRLAGMNYREARADARGWLEDCYGPGLPDGRSTRLLGDIDIWTLIAKLYDGSVRGFIEDGDYVPESMKPATVDA